MKKDDVIPTPHTTPCSTPPPDGDGGLVMGEFDASEVARSPLDNINKKDRDYTHVRHLFATGEQYDLFCMLPGGDKVKDLILSDLLDGEDQR